MRCDRERNVARVLRSLSTQTFFLSLYIYRSIFFFFRRAYFNVCNLFFFLLFFFYFTINCYKAGSGSEECSSVLSSEAELCNITTESKKSVSDHFSFLFFFLFTSKRRKLLSGVALFFFSPSYVSHLSLLVRLWEVTELLTASLSPRCAKVSFQKKQTNRQTN